MVPPAAFNIRRAVQCYCTFVAHSLITGDIVPLAWTRTAFTGEVDGRSDTCGIRREIICSDMAEDICKLLEQTMLRYFPQAENDAGQPRPSSVPLVPHRREKPPV